MLGQFPERFDAMGQKLTCYEAEQCQRPEERGSLRSLSEPKGGRRGAHSASDEDVLKFLLDTQSQQSAVIVMINDLLV